MKRELRSAVHHRIGEIRGVAAATALVIIGGGVLIAGCTRDPEISVPAVEPVTATGVTVVDGSEPVSATAVTSGTQPNGEAIPTTTGDGANVTEAPAIPGLDSPVEFCSAWSRFTGSYTLVAPAWAVSVDPDLDLDVDPAVIEVVASPTMVSAYFELGKNWPDDIEDVQQEGMDSYRPLFERMNRSFDRLKAAGATQGQLEELGLWWEQQLADFNGDSFPTFDMVPPDLQPMVIAATEQTRSDEVPMVEDTALLSDGVNAVYDYLAVSCPDRGQLAGEGVADTVGADEP